MDITLYKEMCAELLDMIPTTGFGSKKNQYYTKLEELGKCVIYKNVLFETDWNWIMSVIEAIEKLEYEIDKTGIYTTHCVEIFSCYTHIKGTQIHSVKTTKKGSVINAINEFLILKKDNKL